MQNLILIRHELLNKSFAIRTPLFSFRRPWDAFRIMERDRKRRDVHMHTSFQIIKLFMYTFLFIMVLASLVVQKISLVIATSKLRSQNNYPVGNLTTAGAEGVDQQVLMISFC